jgi:hypothetical protein
MELLINFLVAVLAFVVGNYTRNYFQSRGARLAKSTQSRKTSRRSSSRRAKRLRQLKPSGPRLRQGFGWNRSSGDSRRPCIPVSSGT